MRFASRLDMPIVLAAIGAALISGCSGESGGNSAGGRRFVRLGTAPIGGAFNVVGSALAEVVNAHRIEGVTDFSAVATKGSQQNIRDLDKGDLNFALANAAITYFAVRGEGDWEKPYEMRAVMTLAPNVAMFITLQSSGIRTISDLKGKRVSIGPAGAGFEYFVGPLLEAHGVTFADFKPQHATQSAAVDQLGDGAIAAAFLGGAVPTASITQACASQDIFFIPYDEAAKAKLIEQYPFFHSATIKAGVYTDLTEDFAGLNVGSMHLITSASQDEDLVYQVTKTIYENRSEVTEKHPAGKSINPENVVHNTGVEFHPGAIRYYQEIGIWPNATSAVGEAEPKSQASGE